MATYGYIAMMEWGRGDESTATRFATVNDALKNVLKRIAAGRKKPFVEFRIDEVLDNASPLFKYRYDTVLLVTGIKKNGVWKAYVDTKKDTLSVLNMKGEVLGKISRAAFSKMADETLGRHYKV